MLDGNVIVIWVEDFHQLFQYVASGLSKNVRRPEKEWLPE
jgi:hypothetical protein